MYGTFTTKMNDKSINVLNKIYKLPDELWITIINHYCLDFTLACLNTQFYDVFHVILLDSVGKLYITYKNNIYNFNSLYTNTSLLLSYKHNKSLPIQNKINTCILSHPHAYNILKTVENKTITNEINEQHFIFLSQIYNYPYESILSWKVKGYCCLGIYIPCFVVSCPCWCPYVCYDVVTHLMGRDDDFVYKVFQPLSVTDITTKRYYDPCDFSKYIRGTLCMYDEPKSKSPWY